MTKLELMKIEDELVDEFINNLNIEKLLVNYINDLKDYMLVESGIKMLQVSPEVIHGCSLKFKLIYGKYFI